LPFTSALCSISASSKTSRPRRSHSLRHHSRMMPRTNTASAPTEPASKTSAFTVPKSTCVPSGTQPHRISLWRQQGTPSA